MKIVKWIAAAGIMLMLISVCSYFGSVFNRAGQQAAMVNPSTPVVINQPQKFKPASELTKSATERATKEAPLIGKVGETLAQGGYLLTVTQVESAENFGDFVNANKGMRLIAVELIVESTANKGVSVNPMYTSIRDADGYEYNGSIFGREPSLKSQNDLPRGEKMRGWVTFEIPEKAKGLMFTYQPITFQNDVRLRVGLGQ